MKNRCSATNRPIRHPSFICDENGSIIVIVVMLLALMSIIGISSTNTTITENLIVRNAGIRKENLHMVDAVAAEAYQRVNDVEYSDPADPTAFLTVDEILPEMPGHFVWVHDKDVWQTSGNLADWYDRDFVGRVLVAGNSAVPESIFDPTSVDPDEDNKIMVINNRGEWAGDPANSPIRYALVGWEFVTEGESIVVNQPGAPTLKRANLLVEYVSEDFGVMRLIVGIKKEFS
ncbi:MAG: pilus assembly PilX N-terminal domain-containing protein [Desulfosalsimonadaceae bacterium]|nr:pilus assembly PilX N-terminal domain-containing protein [Desulfosalsimonadaceae bacterium]